MGEMRAMIGRLKMIELQLRPLVRLRFEMNRGLMVSAERVPSDDAIIDDAASELQLLSRLAGCEPSHKEFACMMELETHLSIMFAIRSNRRLWRQRDIPLNEVMLSQAAREALRVGYFSEEE